jgi:hypothetical protein
MKKMNFSLRLMGKILLPVFLLISLVFISAQANAQSSTELFVEKVKLHVNSLPDTPGVTFPSFRHTDEQVYSPKYVSESKTFLERHYGLLVIDFIVKNGVDDGKHAIDLAYDVITKKVPVEHVNKAKQVYLSLL